LKKQDFCMLQILGARQRAADDGSAVGGSSATSSVHWCMYAIRFNDVDAR
jgi:hypothetical protein